MMKEKEKEKIVLVGLVLIIVVVVVIVMVLVNDKKNAENISIEEIIRENKTEVIYVENSDKKKCENCKAIKKYLNKKNIKYVLYDVNKYKKEEYAKMLQSLSINPNDFNYPAIIYIKDGSLYSNIINIKEEKVIDKFFEDNNILKLQR